MSNFSSRIIAALGNVKIYESNSEKLKYKLDGSGLIKLFTKSKLKDKYSKLVNEYVKKYSELFRNELTNVVIPLNVELTIEFSKESPDGLMGYFGVRNYKIGYSTHVICINIPTIESNFKKRTINLKVNKIESLIEYVVLHEMSHLVSISMGNSIEDNLYHREPFQKYFLRYRSNLVNGEFKGDSIITNFSEYFHENVL